MLHHIWSYLLLLRNEQSPFEQECVTFVFFAIVLAHRYPALQSIAHHVKANALSCVVQQQK